MSVSFKQRECDRYKNFIPEVKYDPHFLCVSCRGGRCEFNKKSCDFCIRLAGRKTSGRVWLLVLAIIMIRRVCRKIK